MNCAICLQALWVMSLLVYVLIANIVIGKIIEHLKKDRNDGESDKNRGEAVGWLGYFEILAYILSCSIGFPQFIVLWIGVRTVERWKMEKTPTGTINIFLIGTLLTVIFGVLGGTIFIKLGELMYLKDFLAIIVTKSLRS